MLCHSGIFIGRPTCCVEVDVHTQRKMALVNIHHSISKTLTLCPHTCPTNYLKLLTLCLYELIKMLNMFISITFKQSIAAMHQTSCQPSACKEVMSFLVFVFPSASSISQKVLNGFQLNFTYFYFIIFFVFIYFVLFWGLFHQWFDPVKVLQRPTIKRLKIHHLQKYDYILCTVS